MCRYYGQYKQHFACFKCRKGFKRPEVNPDGSKVDVLASCPDCSRPMNDMGLDFKTPKRTAIEHWEVVEFLFKRGFTYHSCGCNGPGDRPSRWEDVSGFLESHTCRSAGELLQAKFAARRRLNRTKSRV